MQLNNNNYFLYINTKVLTIVMFICCHCYISNGNWTEWSTIHAAKLSDYSYPITKSSNWTAVIGYPRDNYVANRRAENQSRASILL